MASAAGVGVLLLGRPGCLIGQEAGAVGLGCIVGQSVLHRLEPSDGYAECPPLLHILHGDLHRGGGQPHQGGRGEDLPFGHSVVVQGPGRGTGCEHRPATAVRPAVGHRRGAQVRRGRRRSLGVALESHRHQLVTVQRQEGVRDGAGGRQPGHPAVCRADGERHQPTLERAGQQLARHPTGVRLGQPGQQVVGHGRLDERRWGNPATELLGRQGQIPETGAATAQSLRNGHGGKPHRQHVGPESSVESERFTGPHPLRRRLPGEEVGQVLAEGRLLFRVREIHVELNWV